jgi:DNA-binding response OmpR family regulator
MLSIMSMSPMGAPQKVLIVDDDDLLSEVLVRSLEAHGYDVSHAPGGIISPECSDGVQLVILDAHIPGSDFASTLRMLRDRSVGVLVLSGELSPPVGVSADDYLGKPVGLPHLLAAVARLASPTPER